MVLLVTVGAILLLWGILTLLAERKGSENLFEMGSNTMTTKALVVYNPDLFYDFDRQICTAFAKGLTESGWHVKVATVAASETLAKERFDLYVFCANTYNWAPDQPTKRFIETHVQLSGKNAVAITLGSGSTKRAQRILENLIKKKGANLIGSKTYWLMKPNDDDSTKDSNVAVGVEKAYGFGIEVGQKIK